MKKPEERRIKPADIELHAEAWTRFGRAVDAAAKSGPKHKQASKASTTLAESICASVFQGFVFGSMDTVETAAEG